MHFSVSFFPDLLGYHQWKCRGSLSLFPAPPICSYLYNKEHDSTATQSQVTDALTIHPTPCPSPPKWSLSDQWAASPVPQCLFLFPLAPQEDLLMETFHDLTEVKALSTVNVSAPVFICDEIVVSLYFLFRQTQLYSSDNEHSHWGMYFLVWETSEEKSIINADLFHKDIKKKTTSFTTVGALLSTKFSFFYFFYFFIFENFPEKQCVIVGHIEIERSYMKQTFRQDTLCFTLESLE